MSLEQDIAFGSERLHRTMHFIIHDNPIALARCRMTGAGKLFDSQKQLKLVTGLSLSSQLGSKPIFTGALSVDFKFYFPIPKTYSAQRKNLARHKPHVFKPDLDNIIKFYLDTASNGVLFKDDAIIATINAQKLYDDIGHVEFTISEIL